MSKFTAYFVDESFIEVWGVEGFISEQQIVSLYSFMSLI